MQIIKIIVDNERVATRVMKSVCYAIVLETPMAIFIRRTISESIIV